MRGLPLSYFFSLSETEKVFAYAALSTYREEERERLKIQLKILAAGKGMSIRE